jgi:DNA-binding transcriptional ArsR family regulator
VDSSLFLGYALGMTPPTLLSDRARERMALRFKALGEPMRLKILERLFRSPSSVSEILLAAGGTQANVSKHLSVLRSGGLVRRRKEGNRTVYWISDPSLEQLCAVVCNAVEREAQEEARALTPAAPRRRARG